MNVTFIQMGQPSRPFPVGCELGLVGLRSLSLIVEEASHDRTVSITASMGRPQFFPGELVRNALDPAVGFHHFYNWRIEGVSSRVIVRHNYRTEFEGHLDAAVSLYALWLDNPHLASATLLQYLAGLPAAYSEEGRPQPVPRIPFRDILQAQADSRSQLSQTPLQP